MRPIDADALKEKFAEILESTYTDDYAKGYVNGLRAALNMPTLTPPNEPLTCRGCMYLPDCPSGIHCYGCARLYTDNYRRPPEGEEDT